MHILLGFILFFIIAIIVIWPGSIVGFRVKNNFRDSDAVRHRHITERPDKANNSSAIRGSYQFSD